MDDVQAPPANTCAGWSGRLIDGKFQVNAQLGKGAMGEVYAAHHRLLDKPVALKVLHPSLATDPHFVDRFHREALAASKLDHPACVRVHDVGVADGRPYLALEYVPGSNLHTLLREGPALSPVDIVGILLQVLQGLDAAHDAGMVHRDLKPENILVTPHDGAPAGLRYTSKVCDFGIAYLERGGTAPALTCPGMVMGTPEYMAPEQARAEAVDARTDVYAAGAVLYHMLTGAPPFTATSPVAVLMQQITDAPKPPETIRPGVHRGLAAVAMRALCKHADQRYPSARAMAEALHAALTHPERELPTVSTPALRLPKLRSPQTMWVALGAAFAVPLALASVLLRPPVAHAEQAAPPELEVPAPTAPGPSDAERAARAERELADWYAALSEPAVKVGPKRARKPHAARVRSYYDLQASREATPATPRAD